MALIARAQHSEELIEKPMRALNADLFDNKQDETSPRTPRITHQTLVLKNVALEASQHTSLDSTVMMHGSPRDGRMGGLESKK